MHFLILVNVDVDDLSGDARSDRHDVGPNLRVIRRLFAGRDQGINSVEDQNGDDSDRDDEVDPFRAIRLDGRLVLGDFRHGRHRRGRRRRCLLTLHYISTCTSTFSVPFGVFRKNTSGNTHRNAMPQM